MDSFANNERFLLLAHPSPSIVGTIHERQRVEQFVEKNQSRMHEIILDSDDAILVFEPVRDSNKKLYALRCALINPAAEKLLQWDASKLIGQGSLQSLPIDGLYDQLIQTIEDGRPLHTERAFFHFEPPRRYTSTAVKLGDAVVLTFSEVFAREQPEATRASVPGPNEAIQSTRTKDLEHQVNERTAQLRAANLELQEFVYLASHDLRAPLRVLDNASQWLEEDLRDQLTVATRETLHLLRGRVGRMEKMLDDLLDYARMGHSPNHDCRERLAGDVLLQDVLALVPHANFTVNVSPVFATIQVCRMPLQQILMNLIDNAIKHHDKQQGCVEVSAEESSEYYTFAVKDDGPGIPVEFHQRVFRLFQKLKPRDEVEGSGMGLALVRKNVEIFGGAIELHSAEGQGSIFRFTWPKQQQLRTDPGRSVLDIWANSAG